MKRLLRVIAFMIVIVTAVSCATQSKVVYVPQTKTEYVERLKDTTIYVEVPKEVYINMCRDTSSSVETSLASSKASYHDGILKHSIENKANALKTKVEYKEVMQHDTTTVVKIEYVDKIVEKTVLPKIFWVLLTWCVLTIIYIALKLFIKK